MNFIPSASTVSWVLASVDSNTADMMVKVVESIPLQRLRDLKIKRVTIDFDGSITATNGHLEGTAVGFNPKKLLFVICHYSAAWTGSFSAASLGERS